MMDDSDPIDPLREGAVDDLMVVAQIGQSLDGRSATESGHSHYINEAKGLAHLHRLRAACEAVVVGVGTAIADNPRLTVREAEGRSPARVVIDPHGRLPMDSRLLVDDGVRRLIVIAYGTRISPPAGIEVVRLPAPENGRLQPSAILNELALRGLRKTLIEGGADTVSRFIEARCVDRLHVMVAPLILGSGRAALTLPVIESVNEGLRPPVHVHRLGSDVLFDCDLSAHRIVIGRAKTST